MCKSTATKEPAINYGDQAREGPATAGCPTARRLVGALIEKHRREIREHERRISLLEHLRSHMSESFDADPRSSEAIRTFLGDQPRV